MALNDRIANKVTQENWKQYSDAWRFRQETYPGLVSAQSVRQSRDLGWPTDFKIHTEKTGATNTIFFDRVAKLGRGIVGDQELILPPVEPSPSPSLSPSVSPSLSPSGSLSPSVSPSLSPSGSLSPSPSGSPSPSVSPSPSISPSPSVGPSPGIDPIVQMTITWSDAGVLSRTLFNYAWSNGQSRILTPTFNGIRTYGASLKVARVWQIQGSYGSIKLLAARDTGNILPGMLSFDYTWQQTMSFGGVPFGTGTGTWSSGWFSHRIGVKRKTTGASSTVYPDNVTMGYDFISYAIEAPFANTHHQLPHFQTGHFGSARLDDKNGGWIDIAWTRTN